MHVAMIAMRCVGALVGRPEPRRRVHPLVEDLFFLNVDMAIDVNDADVAVDVRRYPEVGKYEAVVSAADDRKYA